MKSLALFILISTLVLISPRSIQAQTDLLILNQSVNNTSSEVQSQNSPSPDNLRSGRYTVKPRATKPKPPPPPPVEREKEVREEESGPQESLSVDQATTLPYVAPDPAKASGNDTEDPNVLERARDFMMGGSPQKLDEYRSYLLPDDPKRNILEMSLGTFFMYNDSNSPYWYRSYNNFAPGFSVAADIWFTMFFGLNTTYKRTVAGAIRNSPTASSSAAATHEWASIGFKFRRFYGFGKSASSLTMGLDFRDYYLRVPTDDLYRLKLRTTGARLTLEAKLPSSKNHATLWGFELSPWAKHTESSGGTSARTGSSNETFAVGLYWGGEYNFERTSRVFWKLSYLLERSLYSDSATVPDPINGSTPTNTPVNNGFGFFEVGYTWGK